MRLRDRFQIVTLDETLEALNLGFMYGIALVMFYTFFVAYHNPLKFVVVYIDLFHEANFEAVLFSAMLVFCTIETMRVARKIRRAVSARKTMKEVGVDYFS